MNWMCFKGKILQREPNKGAYKFTSTLSRVQSDPLSKLVSSQSLSDLKLEIQCLVALVEEEYGDELYNPLPPQDGEEEEDDEGDDNYVHMIGSSDQYYKLKNKLLEARNFEFVLPLVGMPGIGKTTLARNVFVDPDIVKHFEVRVWLTVGGKCSLNEIPRRILARVNQDRLNKMMVERDVASDHLRKILKGKRYLIVLDDVWERNMLANLQPSSIHGLNSLGDPLPYQANGSCVLFITRLQQGEKDVTMRLLNKEESWDLLREKVFGEEPCSTRLEKAGKKIAENCEGLPLTIVTLADHLSKIKEVEQYWDEVAAKENHKLFKEVYNQISKVIRPSYNYLPQLLQSRFLYMGVFPQNFKIPRSKVITKWNVDGFLERNGGNFDALNCLEELVSNSLVMIYVNSSSDVGDKRIKTCGLHSSLWHFSTTEARKNKFCHVLSSLGDGLDGDMIDQPRLSFHNNILCTIENVDEFVEENCTSTTRSLLYYGPYNPYQVPICFGLRLLRELDILTIRFYEFPMEVLKLAELRYFALILDRKLPASISQLSNLRFLIVGQHFVVINPSRDRYLPMEIWNMQELRHLQALGSDLPHPGGASLENLSTLSNVGACTCTEEVFKAIPNLDKLGFRIELGPNDEAIPLRCFDHISHLRKLTSLKCVVVNPKIIHPPSRGLFSDFPYGLKLLNLSKLGCKETSRNITCHHRKLWHLSPVMALPSGLTKLTLSGLSFSWKEMTKIASLRHLKVLKLRNYAFRGPVWRVKNLGFPSLHYLLIEDSDLVEWNLGSECFKCLERLTLKHCYKYERMVGKLGGSVTKIATDGCNPLGILQMKEAMSSYPWIEWECNSSFIDGENKPANEQGHSS